MVSAVAFAACILSLQFAQATNDGVYEDNGLKQHSGNDFRSSRMPMFKRQATAGVESPVPVLQFVLTIMDFTSSWLLRPPVRGYLHRWFRAAMLSLHQYLQRLLVAHLS
ncbi:hypothetical protein RB213_011418 [Colletotrichum asianum]